MKLRSKMKLLLPMTLLAKIKSMDKLKILSKVAKTYKLMNLQPKK